MKLFKDQKLPPPKILLGGLPGAGKTALLASYGEGMQVLALDNALATCHTLKDQYYDRRMAIDVIDCVENDPQHARSYARIKSHLVKLVNTIPSGLKDDDGKPIVALGIDGLTFLVKTCMDYILYNSGKLGKGSVPDFKNNPSMPEWGLMIGEIVQIFQLIRALPIPVIVSCHYEAVLTPMGGTRYEVAIPTKELPRQIPGMVDEVWFLDVQQALAGKTPSRILHTTSSPLYGCRSNYNLLEGTDAVIGMRGILERMGYK